MLEFVDALFDHIRDFIFMSDGLYCRGVVVGMALVVTIGFYWAETIRDIQNIQAFFAPIPPSLRPSPSGCQTMLGCLGGLFRLVFFYAILVVILWGFFYATFVKP